MSTYVPLTLVVALLLVFANGQEEAGAAVRQPVALVAAAKQESFFAACANGDIVRLDGRAVGGAWRVARSLTDLVALDDGRLAATDPEGGEVLVLAGLDASVVERHPVTGASSVVQAGEHLVVGSLWGRTLTRLPLAKGAAVVAPLALPFSPREMAWSPETGQLVVADAFGGGLGVVDVASWRLRAARELPAVNLRGLVLTDRGRLLVAHQILDALGHASFDDLHWGNLVRNVVREIDLDAFVNGSGSPAKWSRVTQLGAVERGAGDPSSLTLDANGSRVVTLAGTDELAFLDAERSEELRIAVGRRPVAALARDGGRTYAVANSLGGSISFVNVEAGGVTTVELGPRPSDDLVARGERLFFDARLSHDGWMSCHSCHSDGHSSGQLADTLGDDTFGTPKRVPSLFGVDQTAPYAWNGGQPTLEAQIEKSLRTTMYSEDFDETTVAALAAYLRTLPPPPRVAVEDVPEAVARGRELFGASGCTECHPPPLFTSPASYVVGLEDERGADEFNPPSLRGLPRRSRLFHDGRYRELEKLIARAEHPGSEVLDDAGISDLAAYLRTL